MEYLQNVICRQNVFFQRVTEKTFHNIDLSKLKFFFISRSGAIDTPGNIYFFTSDKAFFMFDKGCDDDFIDRLFSKIRDREWNKVNIYFCDDLIIDSQIYDFFIHKLCSQNIRDFWFEAAINIYKNLYLMT